MSQPQQGVSIGRALVVTAAVIIVIAGMRAAQPIIVPFLLSVFIAIISAPALLWLEEHRLPRWAAMVIVVAGIIAVGIGLTVLVGSSVRDFSRDIPVYKVKIDGQVDALLAWLATKGVTVSRTDVMGYVDPGKALQLVGDLFNGFGGLLTNSFLIFLTVVFILFETSTFEDKLHAIVDDPEHSLDRFHGFTEKLRRYLAIKTLASLGTGIAISVSLALIGVDYPLVWGLLAFLLNYVPNIGSIIAAVPPMVLAMVQLGPAAALGTGAAFLAVNTVFGNVIEPRFMGRTLGLSTLVVFLSLVFWGFILGLVGMFLSVPLTMTVKIALETRPNTRWIAVMLGSGRAARATLNQPDADFEVPETPSKRLELGRD